MTIAHAYTGALAAMADKKVDWISDTIVCVLLEEGYTPDLDDHVYLSDLTDELSGGGYARVNLTGKTLEQTAGTVTLSAATVEFAALTADPGPRYAVFAVSTGVDSSSNLLSYMDFEEATVIEAQTAQITIPETGILVHTAS